MRSVGKGWVSTGDPVDEPEAECTEGPVDDGAHTAPSPPAPLAALRPNETSSYRGRLTEEAP